MSWEQDLKKKHPDMFKECFEFSVGDGWRTIVEGAIDRIVAILSPEELSQFRIIQIKEKFGGLRVYHNAIYSEIDAIITQAEGEADRTCDRCGAPGKLMTKGWMAVRCDDHQ